MLSVDSGVILRLLLEQSRTRRLPAYINRELIYRQLPGLEPPAVDAAIDALCRQGLVHVGHGYSEHCDQVALTAFGVGVALAG